MRRQLRPLGLKIWRNPGEIKRDAFGKVAPAHDSVVDSHPVVITRRTVLVGDAEIEPDAFFTGNAAKIRPQHRKLRDISARAATGVKGADYLVERIAAFRIGDDRVNRIAECDILAAERIGDNIVGDIDMKIQTPLVPSELKRKT